MLQTSHLWSMLSDSRTRRNSYNVRSGDDSEKMLKLLDEIFSYYHTNDEDDGECSHTKQRTLLALAVACRAFQDHAIAALWRRLVGFRRPILCFLRNAVKLSIPLVTKDKWDKLGWKLCQSLSREEWHRFEKYASHIRELTLEREDFRGISNFMAFLSVKYLPHGLQGHLLPKLRTLIWRGDQATEFPFIHLFAPPSMQSLTVVFHDEQADIVSSSLLSTLEYHLLSLTYLEFDESDTSLRTDEYLTTISRVIESRSCWGLETFHGDAMDVSALQHLSQLPNLKVLTIHIVRNSSGMALNKGFSNLKSLQIISWYIDPIFSLFRAVRMQLETIQLEFLDGPTFSQAMLQDLVSLITSQPCHRSLIELNILTAADPDRFNSTMDDTIIRQLFVFRHLGYLSIHAVCTFDLNDNNLIELAAAWPGLYGLVLNGYSRWHRIFTITFKGLASLLRGCPLLEILDLSIDATQLDFGSLTVPGEGALNHGVVYFNLGDSIIEDAAAVARILADIFGSLGQVGAWRKWEGHREDERLRYQPLWAEVNAILKSLPEEEND
ncbi:hypothetical protein BJ138DRAFT_1182361 [Hygrophoropsis aurantiaca]|uniref:Uncharacterized protein n=1 Tax=Hygrophoropsis aurantiaca TaxID=72124 RepID=A0ACB8A3G6_9AGAM|nr:hypothetical protein BJ138DRAFT_1182361 [Hygrophoropsis aurantiaca]